MNIQDLKNLIKNGESATLEFKKSTAQLAQAMQTICAFLNGDKGGNVLIGVTDKGNIVGQNIADITRQEIAREIAKIHPHADIRVGYVPLDNDLSVIVISANKGFLAPYVYDDRAFLRSESTTVRMPQEKYQRLLFEKPNTIRWEELTSNNCSIAQLDENRIDQVITAGIFEKRISDIARRDSTVEILKKLKLIKDNRLTNAAVILFSKKDDNPFVQCKLKLARFKGINKDQFLDNKQYCKNAFDLYEHAMAFLNNHLPIAGKIEEEHTPFRVDTPAIPFKVLREAVVNALCHRDYSSYSGSISLAIYDDRVEITNTGRLPRTINIKDLDKTHASQPRNPLIADVFYICGMIEQWGRGTQDMVEWCKNSSNPRPKFSEMTDSFSVTLPLLDPIGDTKKITALALSDRQREILLILKNSSYNGEEIREKLADQPTVRTVQTDLKKLEQIGLIKRSGKARALVWSLVS